MYTNLVSPILFLSILVKCVYSECVKNYDFSDACAAEPLTLTFPIQPHPHVINEVNCDSQHGKQHFVQQPIVQYKAFKADEYYTLIMIDPDAPQDKAAGKAYLHWIVANNKGGELKDGKITTNALIPYKEPTPPAGSGTHNYQLYLFSQDGKTVKATAPSSRSMFSIHEFATKNSLCGPVASVGFKTAF